MDCTSVVTQGRHLATIGIIKQIFVCKTQWAYFNIGYFKNRLYTGLGRTNNPLQPSGHYMYRQFNIQQFYILPTQCIYVFCIDLGTNSDYFCIQH
jgi:hypothetical protein